MKHTAGLLPLIIGLSTWLAPTAARASAVGQGSHLGHIRPGQPACVATVRLNARVSPGHVAKPAYDVLAELPRGTPLTIVDGPAMTDRIAWWLVEAPGDFRGWVAEWSVSGRQLLAPGPCPARLIPPPPTAGYTVRLGDTLGQLADRFGTTVADLMRLNQLQSSRLDAGQFLWVPPPAAVPAHQTRLLGDIQWADANGAQIMVLQAGTTSWSVWVAGAVVNSPIGSMTARGALAVGATVEIIGTVAQFGHLTADQIFIVDVPGRPSAAPTFLWPYREPPPGVAAFPRRHVVQPGETLYRLAAQYGTTIDAIRHANGMTAGQTTIRAYDTLVIP